MSDTSREPLDVRQLREQDPDAFARLVSQYQEVVLGVGQSLGLAGADLDDAGAEAFAEVYRSLPTFEARSELSTWVYRIAFRTMLRLRRRAHGQRSAELPLDRPDPGQRPPDDVTAENERNAMVWKAVSTLEPRQAMAVELYYRRGWAVDRIAAVMECPAGTVKTLLSRARGELRSLFIREGIEP